MQFVAITAVGRDRPGIVAEFSGALFRFGCNLEETTMTRLRGEFAMLLLARLPEEGQLQALQAALRETADQMGLSVVVRPLPVEEAFPEPSDRPAPAYILRVYGADRPGIVHAVTTLLGEREGNITDLNTRLLTGAAGPVYVLVLEVDFPSTEAAETIRPEMERLRRELQVDLTFSELEEEAL